MSIPTTNPTIRLYEKDPALGTLFNRSLLGNEELLKEEIQIHGYPYYFSIGSRESLEYEWTLNSNRVSATDGKAGITLRRSGDAGEASLSLSVQNMARILQRASTSLGITF